MNRQHFAATTGKRLAAQYFIADANAQLTFSANMLFQWNNAAPVVPGAGVYRWTGFSFPVDGCRR
ncbi:hypothetical protein ACLK1U_09485 [Escherichia coli]